MMNPLIIAPILLPMFTATLLLLVGGRRRKIVLSLLSTIGSLTLAILLLQSVKHNGAPGAVGVYLPSNWDVPYGIVLAADRLSALMLVLTAVVALASLLFASARWDRAGVHFHVLFQLQLMGLNGVFLTADVFNLFVFFEVMLSASYGLLLHGSGRTRVKAGLHYIAMNLAASSLFLIGASMLYGVTGTLNFADLAQRIPQLAAGDRGLLHAAAAVLAIAFLTKAAMWPLNFWLVPAYTAASAPVAALFAIMTKVGVYTLLRLWSLLFPESAGGSAFFGGTWLLYGGIATLLFGAMSMLASQKVDRLASLAVLVSSGTLLAAISFGQPAVTSGALFYLLSSTLALAALFLLAELVERSRLTVDDTERTEARGVAFPEDDLESPDLDAEGEPITGRAIPASMAFLGISFIACTLLVAGLPPLSGFIGKFAMLSALMNPLGLGAFDGTHTPIAAWVLLGLLIVSGLLSLVSLTGAGVRYFWTPLDRPAPHLRIVECLPIAALLLCCVVLSVRAETVMHYLRATTEALQSPSLYVESVMSARPLPSPTRNAP